MQDSGQTILLLFFYDGHLRDVSFATITLCISSASARWGYEYTAGWRVDVDTAAGEAHEVCRRDRMNSGVGVGGGAQEESESRYQKWRSE